MKKQKIKSNKKSAGGMKNLDVGIDSFGTLQMNNSIDAINKFLDENISDKKMEQKSSANKKVGKK